MSLSLVEHKCQHFAYRMTCEDFDALALRSQGLCELCFEAADQLHIDHDHALGWGAVRGLVCPRCNALLRDIERGRKLADARVKAYFADSWHLGRLLPRSRRRMQRTVRVEDAIWDAALVAADANNETVSDVVRRALVAYIRRNK
jgi:hypothetical protein